ncbi:hypothetical protein J2Z48_002085 [Croceifilum oryzae]|uniref:DNA primase/polymerase bifunctional N-terminal domain-containing protein n=1 Tax=Croceifilum oryzae TaxID=1553429 RepID=A0AAJ1TNW2_9BACL|nr:DUF3987 domain-containing protein [Croceifilum oryzae]MDQ0417901.1 hypothetical protein [Croceifilum oryzae]
MIESQIKQTLPLEEALRLAQLGLKVIPLHTPVNGSCTCGRNICKSAGKHPIWSDWMNKATDDVDEIRSIWRKTPNANIGIPMGRTNGIFALDIDGSSGMETLQGWISYHGGIPATWQIITGGGTQLWYRMPTYMDIPNSVKKVGINIDIRGSGGQSVAPGSKHPSGKTYQWVPGRSPDEIKLADPPEWLLNKIQEVMEAQRKVEPSHDATTVTFGQSLNLDFLMRKANELTQKSKLFREVTMQEKVFVSASERDLSIANIAAIHGWSDQEILDFLIQYRKFHGEHLKHPLYYQLTITKARQWAQENQMNEQATPDEVEIEAIPLPKLPNVNSFPTDIFPSPIATFLNAASTSLGLPADYVGIHMLTFLGTAVGSSRMIELKPGYRQQPNLYTCIIADTGTGKSPAQESAFSPILESQHKYHEIYQQKMKEYEVAFRQYQAKLSVWKKNSKNQDLPEEPEKPQMKELYIVQSTIEALVRALKQNDRGLVLKADELSGWIRGMNQYKGGKGDDREQFLSLWSGTDIKVNRVRDNGEPIFISKPFFSVTGNIPPDIVATLEDEQGEDGFIHRILFSYPDVQDPSDWTWVGVPTEVVHEYSQVLEELYRLKHIEVGTTQKPKVLCLSEEAKKWWEEWYSIHINEMKDEEFPRKLRGPWAKMPNQLARMALIVHMARVVCNEATDEEVDAISMDRAAQLTKYFKSHAKKVYLHLKKTQVDKRIEEAVEWIRKKGGVARKRDIQMHRVANCKKSSEVDVLFGELRDFGYGTIQKVQPKRGRPTLEFVLFE